MFFWTVNQFVDISNLRKHEPRQTNHRSQKTEFFLSSKKKKKKDRNNKLHLPRYLYTSQARCSDRTRRFANLIDRVNHHSCIMQKTCGNWRKRARALNVASNDEPLLASTRANFRTWCIYIYICNVRVIFFVYVSLSLSLLLTGCLYLYTIVYMRASGVFPIYTRIFCAARAPLRFLDQFSIDSRRVREFRESHCVFVQCPSAPFVRGLCACFVLWFLSFFFFFVLYS